MGDFWGISAVIKDEQGIVTPAANSRIPPQANLTEALAIRSDILFAYSLSYFRIQAKVDAMEVVEAINSSGKNYTYFQIVASECRALGCDQFRVSNLFM